MVSPTGAKFSSTRQLHGPSINGVIFEHKIHSKELDRDVRVLVRQPDGFDPNMSFGTEEGKDDGRVVDEIGQRQLVDRDGAVIPEEEIGKRQAVGLQPADQVPGASDGKADALNKFLTVAAAAKSMGHPDDLAVVLEGHEHSEASWRNQFIPMVGWLTRELVPTPRA